MDDSHARIEHAARQWCRLDRHVNFRNIHLTKPEGAPGAGVSCSGNAILNEGRYLQVKAWVTAAMTTVLMFGGSMGMALEIPPLFDNGMILQREMEVPVWGSATPGGEVTVRIDGQTHSTVAATDGRWMVRLDPIHDAGPHEMAVTAGERERVFTDVLAGEVWLCSGQSNMGMGLAEVNNPEEEIAAADFPLIRMYRERDSFAEEPRSEPNGHWRICSPETAAGFSATGYYFARRLHRELDVPVGIVVSARGGSSLAAWIRRDVLERPDLRPHLPLDVIGWRENLRPSLLYNAMLHPLPPLAVRGVIWYQGESDAEDGQNPYLHRYTFPAMIADWRALWNRPDMPFYWVQLPNMRRNDDRWTIVRESQAAALSLPHTAMATTIDIGEERKLHPGNKDEFGDRLAFLALRNIHGLDFPASYPSYSSHSVEGSMVRVEFNDVLDGLATTDGEAVRCFTIAGEDGVFHEAAARLSGSTILLTSENVAEPASIRYAWETNPPVNLVNSDGLPLRPFRTDTLPVGGEEMMFRALPSRSALADRFTAQEILRDDGGQWQWAGDDVDFETLETRRLLRTFGNDPIQLNVMNRPLPGIDTNSPVLAWESSPQSAFANFEPERGCTIELRTQIFRASQPFRVMEVVATLPGSDGRFRKYHIAIRPLRVHVLHGEEIRLLGRNLDNSFDYRTYRLAVRPDGVGQLYMDGIPLGIVPGELVERNDSDEPSLRWGKLLQAGAMTANVMEVSYDMSGAYHP